jgi:hypothetical protein
LVHIVECTNCYIIREQCRNHPKKMGENLTGGEMGDWPAKSAGFEEQERAVRTGRAAVLSRLDSHDRDLKI